MLNFVLCDDNINVLNRLSKMLNTIFINYNLLAEITFTTTEANDVLYYTKNNKVDVLILDINLKSNISGIDIATEIRKTNKTVYIIFTTGHLEYAMIAYKVKTFDYLAKPITLERLEDTIIRLFNDITHTPKKYIRLTNQNTIINQDEINFIKRDGMKLIFYTHTNEYHTYSSFNKIQNELPDNFVRCHKSYIANIHNISSVKPKHNTILFNNSNSCFIGPKYKNNLMEVINNYGNFNTII